MSTFDLSTYFDALDDHLISVNSATEEACQMQLGALLEEVPQPLVYGAQTIPAERKSERMRSAPLLMEGIQYAILCVYTT